MSNSTDDSGAGCCGCILLAFVIPVAIGLMIFAFKLGVDVAHWLVNLV